MLLYILLGMHTCWFNERLLLWQPSGILLYSTVSILICFMLCWKIQYDDDNETAYKNGRTSNSEFNK